MSQTTTEGWGIDQVGAGAASRRQAGKGEGEGKGKRDAVYIVERGTEGGDGVCCVHCESFGLFLLREVGSQRLSFFVVGKVAELRRCGFYTRVYLDSAD